jgi:predicted dehydrogenase
MVHGMQDIGVGLIGYGLGGKAFHAPFVQAAAGLDLRAVVSRDAPKVHADFPGMLVLPDVAKLLAHPGIDLVIVSSPDDLHAEHAIAALRAGKHVLVDKPFATTTADARKIAVEAERSGTVLSVFHNRRWDADFRTLRRLIDEGRLGEIVELESRFDRWRPLPAPVWKEARNGGIWLDLGPHLVDQALCLFGRPRAISADLATLRAGAPAPDYFRAALLYDGLRVSLHASKLVADHASRFAVHGTKGSWAKHGIDPQEPAILAGSPPQGADWGVDPVEGWFTSGDAPEKRQRVANEKGDYRLFWQALAAAIRGDGPTPVPVNEALAVMEVLDAGLRSAESGEVVALES